MTVLIIHGIGGHAGIHWQQWLYNRLTEKGYTCLMPNLPNANHPDRTLWLQEIKNQLNEVDLGELIIVGHSLGVTTALDFLEQTTGKIKALISISGFAEDYGAELNSYFLKRKKIDFEKLKMHLGKSYVVYGDNDPYVPQKILLQLTKSLNVKPEIIAKGGHLNTEAGYTTFPYLLEIIEKIK